MTKNMLPNHFVRADYNEYREIGVVTLESALTGRRVYTLENDHVGVFASIEDAYAVVDRIKNA